MNLTAGICVIFRGLNFESNEESGQKSRFRMDTSYRPANMALIMFRLSTSIRRSWSNTSRVIVSS